MNYDTANYEQTESAVIRMAVQANTGMNMINKRPERPEDQQVDHHTNKRHFSLHVIFLQTRRTYYPLTDRWQFGEQHLEDGRRQSLL